MGVAAVVMTLIMILHIKSKYTAVGRKEMVLFFYLYMTSVILELLLATNIIPISAGVYKVLDSYYFAISFSTWQLAMLLLLPPHLGSSC